MVCAYSILPYLCVMQYFNMLSSYMSKDKAKLATFESQKEVVKPLNRGRHG